METVVLNDNFSTGNRQMTHMCIKQETSDEEDSSACLGSVGDNGDLQKVVSDEFLAPVKREADGEACSTSEVDCNIKTECTADVKDEVDEYKAGVCDTSAVQFSETRGSLGMKQQVDELYSTQSESTFLDIFKEEAFKIDIEHNSVGKLELKADAELAVPNENKMQFTPDVYKCNQCEYTTKIKQSLLVHVRIKHNSDTFSQCDYTTKIKGNSQKHVKSKHNPNACLYKCSHCDYTSKIRQNMVGHVKSKHDPKADVYKCSPSEYITKIRQNFLVHVKRKHDPNPM